MSETGIGPGIDPGEGGPEATLAGDPEASPALDASSGDSHTDTGEGPAPSESPEEPAPMTEDEQRELREERHRRRELISDAEKAAGRPLSNLEQRLIVLRYFIPREDALGEHARREVMEEYFPGGLDDIDRQTANMLDRFAEKLVPAEPAEPSGPVITHLGMDGWRPDVRVDREALQDRLEKASGKLVKFIKSPFFKTAALSFGLRTVLHLIPGVGLAAGTIAGAAVGGWRGYEKGKQAMQSESYTLSGVYSHYQRLLSEEDPRSKENALAFLQYVLDNNDGDPDNPSNIFKGDAGQILQLHVFYNAEAKKLENYNAEAQAEVGQRLFEEYGVKVAGDIKEAARKGMITGAKWGAGIGAFTDVASFIGHWIKTDHLQSQYVSEHYGAQNEIPITDSPEIRDFIPDPKDPILDHLPNETSHYGNALSEAIKEGYQSDDLEIPKKVIDEIMAKENLTEPEAVNRFIDNFNYAQPIEGHYPEADGYEFIFNKDGLQELIDHATDGGNLDYEQLAETVKGADRYLTDNFPVRGFEYTLHDQVPFDEGELHRRAVDYARDNDVQAGLQTALGVAHGAAVAGKVDREVEKELKTDEPKIPEVKLPAPPSPETSAEAGAGPSSEAGTLEEGSAETTVEEEVAVDHSEEWAADLEAGRTVFISHADGLLGKLKEHPWDELDIESRQRVVGLFKFMLEFNRRQHKFRINLITDETGPLPWVQTGPKFDEPTIEMKVGGKTAKINLNDKPSLRIKVALQEDKMRRIAKSSDAYLDKDGRYNYANLAEDLTVLTDGKEVSIERKDKSGNIKLYEGDNGKSVLNVAMINPRQKTITVRDREGRSHEINEKDFDKIGFMIKTWPRPERKPR